jgi:tight adherence protein C
MLSPLLILGFGLFLLFLVLIVYLMTRSSPESKQLDAMIRRSRGASEEEEVGSRWATAVERLARPLSSIRALVVAAPDPVLTRRLARAGYLNPAHADMFLAARLVMPALAGLFVAYIVPENPVFFFAIAVVLGYFAPDFWLGEAINRRRHRVNRSLPDGLDLLSICMEAGLGLDQSILRVGQELRASHPELSAEFLQINYEQRAGVPRIDSWKAFADRINLEQLRSFVAMLIQTERFGTPIALSLAVFSDSLRAERRQKAEELAAKASIKLLFPLIFFIFPLVFLVAVGPAIIGMMRNLGELLK